MARPGTIRIDAYTAGRQQSVTAFATGSSGAGPSQNWMANFNLSLPAGTTIYITDSDPSTWSYNSASHSADNPGRGGYGFVRVFGDNIASAPIPGPPIPIVPNPPPGPRPPAPPPPPPPPPPPRPTPLGALCVHGALGDILTPCYVTVTPGAAIMATFVLARTLPAAPLSVQFALNGRATNVVLPVPVAGAGATAGSVHTFAVPFSLCVNPRTQYTPILWSGPGGTGIPLGSIGLIEGYPC